MRVSAQRTQDRQARLIVVRCDAHTPPSYLAALMISMHRRPCSATVFPERTLDRARHLRAESETSQETAEFGDPVMRWNRWINLGHRSSSF
jgi:hypothetical protein